MKAFFFHYNKPASARAQEPVISLHYNGACHMVSNVVVKVPVQGRIRKAQPRWVIAGKSNDIRITNNIAHIS